jgi:hypothetical protein
MGRPKPRRVRPYIWRDREGNETRGIAVSSRVHPIAVHLTIAEAVALADSIVDMVESIEQEDA